MEPVLVSYSPDSAEHQELLLAWREELIASGEFGNLMFPGIRTPGDFLNFFAGMEFSVMAIRDNRIVSFCGVRPNSEFTGDQAVWNFGWASKERRGTRSNTKIFYNFLRAVLAVRPTIMALTAQEGLLKSHLDWGFKYLAEWPPAYGFEKLFMLYLDINKLENSRLAKIGRLRWVSVEV